MLRMRGTALCVMLLSGCLDPLSEDEPGYSRHLLPGDGQVASVSGDPSLARRVDMNDGVSGGTVMPKSGYAMGKPIKYWELGTGRGSATPAYQLARCDDEQRPLADATVDHPLLFDAVPGDPDYTQLWAVSFVCVTPKYNSERITSLSALSDAYELGLAIEPKEPMKWLHAPVVQEGVVLDGATDEVGATRIAYARGLEFSVVFFGEQGSIDPSIVSMGKSVTTGNVYEIVRQGSTKVERVVFGSAGFNEDGSRSPGYAPIWTIVNVTIDKEAEIGMFTQESEIATANPDRTFTKANDKILSIAASMNRTSREVQF